MRPLVRATAIVGALLVIVGMAPAALAKSFSWRSYSQKPDDWFRTEEAARAAENLLSYQANLGDWPKNLDTSESPYTGDRAQLKGTFDNGATVCETHFLARMFRVTGKDRYRDAVIKSLDHILAAQYDNGGWPQTSPPGNGYARYITFNDNTDVNLLELMRDVAHADDFAWIDPKRKEAAQRAFERGIDCILKCQIKVNGKRTVWCAQHDEKTLEPRPARSFELVSLSGSESAGILLLLMSLDHPSADVVQAVEGGARWFEASKLTGIRQVVRNGDKVIVPEPDAPPLWARFHEIDTNRPFFCGRDGVKKFRMDEIEAERRNGYAWYGTWGDRVASRFAQWQKSHQPSGD